jgi:amidase
MFPRPSIEDIKEYGEGLGLKLSPAELRIMHSRMIDQVAALETFNELRIEEQKLPLKYMNRDPGYRPTEEEDPLNVFIRKCRVEGAKDGLLKGKTIGLKDHTAVAGVPMTLGSHFMDGYIPDFDATVVTRLLDAGATITGKLNMDDFSAGGASSGGVGDFERALNPHDLTCLSGGSSSGSGAAVAAGYVDIALGGDQGGSIRVPAAWCGVIGLKATHGLIPHTGVFGLEPTVDYIGPMTRTTEDMAAALQCVAGRDGYDFRQNETPVTLPDYVRVMKEGVQGLRIGILSEGFGFKGSEQDTEQAVLEALGTLEGAGAQLKKVSVPLHEKGVLAILPIFIQGAKWLFDTNFGGAFVKSYYPTSFITTFGRAKQSHGHEIGLNYKMFLVAGAYLEQLYHGRLYAKAQNLRPTFVRQYNEAFREVDLLAMPTAPMKASPFKEIKDHEDAIDRTLFGGKKAIDLEVLGRNTAPFNYTGHPAISVPCGKSGGLPIGLQLVAPNFREDLLLRAAYAYQHSVDWVDMAPNHGKEAWKGG